MVGESGLFTPDDIAYVKEAGVKAVSIANDISTLIKHLGNGNWNIQLLPNPNSNLNDNSKYLVCESVT